MFFLLNPENKSDIINIQKNCSQITAVKTISYERHKRKIGEFNQEHVGRNSAAFANTIGMLTQVQGNRARGK